MHVMSMDNEQESKNIRSNNYVNISLMRSTTQLRLEIQY